MNVVNKVRLEIGGMKYTISTPESEEYVQALSERINADLAAYFEKSASLSINDALVLCLLDYADARRKAEQNADHIREQLTGYLGDASKARMEADELRSELSRLRKELGLHKKGPQN